MKGKKYIIIGVILALICLVAVIVLVKKDAFSKLFSKEEQKQVEQPVEQAATPEPTEEPKVMLPELVPHYEKNPDTIGWIKIEGTPIDNPVMFTPNDNEFYLDKDFDKKESIYGTLYIDVESKLNTPNVNIIMYGHNMKDQTMFGSLKKYRDKAYYDQHPKVVFNTLYDRGEYEIIGAFYAKVLLQTDTSYRYYKFFEAKNEEEFNEFINYVKSVREYDTGVEAQYGDELLTLSTCSSHVENGRFAVVCRRIKQKQGE